MTQTSPFDVNNPDHLTAAADGIGRLLSVLSGAGSSSVPGLTPAQDTSTTGTQTDLAGDSNGMQFGVSQEFGVNGHPGLDISTPVGTPIVAPVAGTVTHAANDDPNGYGRWVEVTGANGTIIRYGHLSGMNVTVGQQVTPGQLLGKTGGAKGADGSGNADGPHLHFEVHQQSGGPAVDPSSYLASGWKIIGDSGVTTNTPSVDAGASAAVVDSPEAAAAAGVNKVTSTLGSTNVTTDPGGEAAAMGSGTQPKPAQTATGSQQGGDTGQFAADILKGIGAPITPANIRAINAWAQAEGGTSHNNPLNTTQGMANSSDFNAVGVKTYASYEDGVAATIRTLENGMYGPIIDALKAGTDPMAVARAIAASPWGTGDLVEKILGGGA